MGLAIVRNQEVAESDINKKRAEEAFQHMIDQLRLIDQKLTTNVDNEVWNCFQSHYKEISNAKSFIRNTIEHFHE